MSRRIAEIEGEEDQHRHRHAAEACDHRQRHAPALAQLAHVELAPRLEADEEEECHQPAVDPLAEALVDPVPADRDREVRRPHGLVRAEPDVRPHYGGDGGGEQHGGATDLLVHEVAHRGGEMAGPGAPQGCCRAAVAGARRDVGLHGYAVSSNGSTTSRFSSRRNGTSSRAIGTTTNLVAPWSRNRCSSGRSAATPTATWSSSRRPLARLE